MTQPAFHLPDGFLFGASTAAHQTEGNNIASDWWGFEHSGHPVIRQPSGDAVDSLHRWPEDMDLLAGLGFNAYRFSIEWARIEPEQGEFSRAAVDHYRRMVDGAIDRGLNPVVTLHHFTSPRWFTDGGGWSRADAVDRFQRYLEHATPIVASGVSHVVTINEPNILAIMFAVLNGGLPPTDEAGAMLGLPEPDAGVRDGLIAGHRAARAYLADAVPGLQTGWSVANQAYQAEPGFEAETRAYSQSREGVFLEVSRDDDFVGVQSYTRTRIGAGGPLPVPDGVERTLMGWEFYPAALGEAVRATAAAVPGVPILVTENGIATDDDETRIRYTSGALAGLAAAMRDGIDVRGYLHWSAIDNYEWGSFEPTFGLIHADRETFARTARPSAHWLGALAREGVLPAE
ncbi:family 1 glycosylhydrolase [Leifsonia poae]|uniref:family 1 glycosylhydrolase n=1 Tax=Leifsonia poae TaxID=110933 RepID=UPI001CBC50D3|nr:family 1 glycosylhydrolase [Leifsonia poae]